MDGKFTGRCAAFLKARYRQSWMIVQTQQKEKLVVQPGSGGLQGDVSMPSQFAAIYDPKIADWIA